MARSPRTRPSAKSTPPLLGVRCVGRPLAAIRSLFFLFLFLFLLFYIFALVFASVFSMGVDLVVLSMVMVGTGGETTQDPAFCEKYPTASGYQARS